MAEPIDLAVVKRAIAEWPPPYDAMVRRLWGAIRQKDAALRSLSEVPFGSMPPCWCGHDEAFAFDEQGRGEHSPICRDVQAALALTRDGETR